jgi:hypothetical protein
MEMDEKIQELERETKTERGEKRMVIRTEGDSWKKQELERGKKEQNADTKDGNQDRGR